MHVAVYYRSIVNKVIKLLIPHVAVIFTSQVPVTLSVNALLLSYVCPQNTLRTVVYIVEEETLDCVETENYTRTQLQRRRFMRRLVYNARYSVVTFVLTITLSSSVRQRSFITTQNIRPLS
jgi:polyferredoxin